MWNLLFVLGVFNLILGEQSCQKDSRNANENEHCDLENEIMKNKVNMIEIAENVLMPEVGYGTWKVVGDESIFKVSI